MSELLWKQVLKGYVFLLAIVVFFIVSQSQPARAEYSWTTATLASATVATSSAMIYNSAAGEFAFTWLNAGGGTLKFTTSTISNSWATPLTITTVTNGRMYSVAMTTSTSASTYYGLFTDMIDTLDMGQSGRNRIYKSAALNGSSWTLQATTTAVTDNFAESELTIQDGSIFIAGNAYIDSDKTFMIAKSTATDSFASFTTSTLYQGSDNVGNSSIHNGGGIIGVMYTRSSSFNNIYTATSTNGVSWGTSTLTGSMIITARMRVDASGKQWVAWVSSSGFNCASGCTLKLSRYEGASGWVTETIDTAGSTWNNGESQSKPIDLAFINGTTPVVAYYNTGAGSVRFAYRDAGNSGCSGADAASYTCGNALTGLSSSITGGVTIATNGAARAMIAASDFGATAIKAATADLTVAAAAAASPVSALQAPPPPPQISSMTINGGATSTISRDVEVELTSGSAIEMVVSTDPTFSGLSWKPFASKSIVTLPETPGTYKIYAKVSSNSGSSAVSEREIIYLPETATGQISFSSGVTSSTVAFAALTYSSNVTQMQLSATSTFVGATWVSATPTSSITIASGDGIKTIYARFKTAAGTTSSVSSATVTLDTTAPTAPTIATPADNAQITTDKPVFAGFAEPLTQMRLTIMSSAQVVKLTTTSTVDSEGAWSIATTSTISDGAYTVQAQTMDAAGNLSVVAVSSFTIVDKVAPAVPTILTPGAAEIIAATSTQVIGQAEPLSKIVVVRNGSATFITNADDKGDWAVMIPGLKNGAYILKAQAIDKAGNASALVERQFSVALPIIQLPEPEIEPVVVPAKKPAAALPPAAETPSAPAEPAASQASPGGAVVDSGIGSAPAEPLVEPEAVVVPAPEIVTITEPEQEATIVQINAAFSDAADFTKETAKAVAKTAVKTVKVIKAVTDQPEVQVANQAVVVPTAAVAAAASVGGAVNGAQALTYLRFLFTQPLFLLTRKRRKGWGIVYNALTKMPSDLATVRLVDSQSGRVVQSQVTDQLGRYQFFAKPGEYRIEVSKPEFQFPAEYLKGKTEDGKYADLYTGDVLRPVAASALSYNTPLDPIGVDKPADELVKAARKKYVAAVLGSAGLVVTAVSFVVSPTLLVGGFLVLHIGSHFMFRRIAAPKKPETWGVISDTAGAPIAQAVVRVFDKQYNKLLDTQVTDEKGRYAFLVGKNDYYLMVEKSGFEKLTSEVISIEESEGGAVLAKNVQLLPPSAQTPPAAPVVPTAPVESVSPTTTVIPPPMG